MIKVRSQTRFATRIVSVWLYILDRSIVLLLMLSNYRQLIVRYPGLVTSVLLSLLELVLLQKKLISMY
jgi:hypothetical protein